MWGREKNSPCRGEKNEDFFLSLEHVHKHWNDAERFVFHLVVGGIFRRMNALGKD